MMRWERWWPMKPLTPRISIFFMLSSGIIRGRTEFALQRGRRAWYAIKLELQQFKRLTVTAQRITMVAVTIQRGDFSVGRGAGAELGLQHAQGFAVERAERAG